MSDQFKQKTTVKSSISKRQPNGSSSTDVLSDALSQSNNRISLEVFRSIRLEFPYYTYSNYKSFKLAYERDDFESMFKILDQNPHVSVLVLKSNQFNSNDPFFTFTLLSALNLSAIDAVKRGWWVELKEILNKKPFIVLTADLDLILKKRSDDEDTRMMAYLIKEAIYENLRRSIILNDLSLFDRAIVSGADLDSLEGRDVLSMAARLDRVDFLERALWMGIDLNEKDSIGWTPMDWALNAGSVDSIKFLSSIMESI